MSDNFKTYLKREKQIKDLEEKIEHLLVQIDNSRDNNGQILNRLVKYSNEYRALTGEFYRRK